MQFYEQILLKLLNDIVSLQILAWQNLCLQRPFFCSKSISDDQIKCLLCAIWKKYALIKYLLMCISLPLTYKSFKHTENI